MTSQSLIIIPTYNEALNIQAMVETLFSLYPEISLLIVDDNSPDKTAVIVSELKNKFPRLHLLKRAGKLGLGTAYVEGFKWALSQNFLYVVQMDCDFSHDPKDVICLLQALKNENADLAIGSRYSDNQIRTKDWSLGRLILSFVAASTIRFFTGLVVRDLLGGFKAFKRQSLEKLNFNKILSKGYVFQFEINFKIDALGLKIQEVPIIFSERLKGSSKMNTGIVMEAVKIFIKLNLKKLVGDLN